MMPESEDAETDAFFLAFELVDQVCNLFKGIKARLRPQDGVNRLYDSDRFDRVVQLGLHLEAVSNLLRAQFDVQAYVLLRPALEQAVVDRLLFLANRYQVVYKPPADTANKREWLDGAYKTILEQQEANPRILGAEIQKNRVLVTLEAPFSKSANGEPTQISIYHEVLDDYSPIYGHPYHRNRYNSGFVPLEYQVERATQHRETYHAYLKWSSLMENLLLNELANSTQVFQLETHYRYLSGFTHLSQSTVTDLFHPNIMRDALHRHCVVELGLQYVSAIALVEFETLLKFGSERGYEIRDAESIKELKRTIAACSSDLWLFHGRPTWFDRAQAANHSAWIENGPLPREPPVAPEEMPIETIGYYDDPLARIKSSHQHSMELTTGIVTTPQCMLCFWQNGMRPIDQHEYGRPRS